MIVTIAIYTLAICLAASIIIWIADGPLALWDARRRRSRIEAHRQQKQHMRELRDAYHGNGRLPSNDHEKTAA